MQIKISISITATVLAVILFITWRIFRNALIVDCDNVVITEKLSPDNTTIASVFERDCGATTDISSMVSIRKASEKFDAQEQHPVFVIQGKNGIALEWPRSNLLVIRFIEGEVFQEDTRSDGIEIAYEGHKTR